MSNRYHNYPPMKCEMCGQECERTNGRQKTCLKCRPIAHRLRSKAWKERNREASLANLRNWQKNNVERRKAYSNEYARRKRGHSPVCAEPDCKNQRDGKSPRCGLCRAFHRRMKNTQHNLDYRARNGKPPREPMQVTESGYAALGWVQGADGTWAPPASKAVSP